MLNAIGFLGQIAPDLTWVPQGIIETDENRSVVRGLDTGTPLGPFFGVDPATGNSFEITSIDIFTVEDSLITHVCHLEDWMGAVAQLSAEQRLRLTKQGQGGRSSDEFYERDHS